MSTGIGRTLWCGKSVFDVRRLPKLVEGSQKDADHLKGRLSNVSELPSNEVSRLFDLQAFCNPGEKNFQRGKPSDSIETI